jgi:hypothetical protein
MRLSAIYTYNTKNGLIYRGDRRYNLNITECAAKCAVIQFKLYGALYVPISPYGMRHACAHCPLFALLPPHASLEKH